MQEREPDLDTLFSLYEREPLKQLYTGQTEIKNSLESSKLGKTYFSKQNIQIIQNNIRYGVFTKSKNQFNSPEQPIEILMPVMEKVFYKYTLKNITIPIDISNHIFMLNSHVIQQLIPVSYQNMLHRQQYLKKLNTKWVPNELPIQTSSTNGMIITRLDNF